MSESYIETTAGHTLYAGADAVALFRAVAIQSAIKLYLATGIRANRAYTSSAMLTAASSITGHSYKRGRTGLAQAERDLQIWCNAMRAALPVVDGNRVSLTNMNPAAMAAAARNACKE